MKPNINTVNLGNGYKAEIVEFVTNKQVKLIKMLEDAEAREKAIYDACVVSIRKDDGEAFADPNDLPYKAWSRLDAELTKLFDTSESPK